MYVLHRREKGCSFTALHDASQVLHHPETVLDYNRVSLVRSVDPANILRETAISQDYAHPVNGRRHWNWSQHGKRS